MLTQSSNHQATEIQFGTNPKTKTKIETEKIMSAEVAH